MKLNILGTKYDYKEIAARTDARMENLSGYCDPTDKIIRVDVDFIVNDNNSKEKIKAYTDVTRRHEIIHAYLYESGMEKWGDDEMLVSWIAIQFPKLLETFKEIGAL